MLQSLAKRRAGSCANSNGMRINVSKSRGKHAKGNTSKPKKGKDLKTAADQVAAVPSDAQGAVDAATGDEPVVTDAPKVESTTENIAADDATRALSPAEKAAARESVVDGSGAYQSEAYDRGAYGDVSPVAFADEKAKRKVDRKKVKKVLGIVCGSIAGLLVAAYLVGIAIFSNWFFPGTSIGAIDASMRSSAEVAAQLDEAVGDYQLTVSGDGFNYTIDTARAGVKIDSAEIVKKMHEALPAWQWPYLLSQSDHALTDLFVANYSGGSTLEADLKEKVEEFNKTATQPQNATIAYDEAKKQFAVKAEVPGTALDTAAVVKAADVAILSFQPSVTLGANELKKADILSTDARLKTAADTATRMCGLTVKLVMAGNDAGSIGPDQISQWIKLEDDFSVSLDGGQLDAYIAELQGKLDTVGSERMYTRPDGKVITVSGGVYGWEVDGEALHSSITEAVKSGVSQTVDIPCVSEGEVYNGAGEKDWGNRYIDIDLAEQHVRMYNESGNLIWESDCISGKPDGVHDTSVGVFSMNTKASPSKLVGYENGKKIYESQVRYWMPFVGNAIGLHDADWQPDFGGNMYAIGYGSHGCVNLPVGAAAELYGLTQEGDVVVSHW